MEGRSNLGQQFRTEHQEGTEAGLLYSACKGRPKRAEFRKAWAAQKLDDFNKTFVKKESWQRVDKEKGKLKNFGQLAQSESV